MFNKRLDPRDLLCIQWYVDRNMSKRYAIDRWSIVDYNRVSIESLGAHVANL